MTAHTFKVGDKGMTRVTDAMVEAALGARHLDRFTDEGGMRAALEAALLPDPPTDARDAIAGTSEPVQPYTLPPIPTQEMPQTRSSASIIIGESAQIDMSAGTSEPVAYTRSHGSNEVVGIEWNPTYPIHNLSAGTPLYAHPPASPNPELEQARVALALLLKYNVDANACTLFVLEHGPTILKALEK